MNTKFITISILTAAILVGCGGGGGGSSAPSTRSISGNVIDPAIKGADVKLICNNKLIGRASTLTDEDGKFTINNIPTSTVLDNCTIEAKGGQDGGDNLDTLVLKAPYNLYENKNEFLITPLTTALTNHDEYFTNKETAKEDIRKFFGITKEDLMKNPMKNMKIAKLTKKITKLALKRDDVGNRIGYVDLDNITSNKDNFINFINSNELKIDKEEKKKLNEELSIINTIDDNSKDMSKLIKNAIVGELVYELKYLYKKETYSAQEISNFKKLSEALAEARKTTQKSKVRYNEVNRIHLGKALSDLKITPSFDSSNGADGKPVLTLKSGINDIITKNTADFESYLENNPFDISNIKGYELYDTKNYKKILSDNNDERVNYYMFSEKSEVVKAMNIIKNSYDDQLLNPAYNFVAQAFIKAGLYDEAKKIALTSIYGDDFFKIQTLKNIALSLINSNQNEAAKDLLDKAFENFKIYAKKGVKNLTNYDNTELVLIMYGYYQMNDAINANKIATYLNNDIVSKLTDSTTLGRLNTTFQKLIFSFIDNQNYDGAKYLISKMKDYLKVAPLKADDLGLIPSAIIDTAILSAILKDKDMANELITFLEKIDTDFNTAYAKVTALGITEDKSYAPYAGNFAALKALLGDVEDITTKVKEGKIKSKVPYVYEGVQYGYVTNDDEESVINRGLIAAYFINGVEKDGKKEYIKKAIDLLFEYRPHKYYEDRYGNRTFKEYALKTTTGYLDQGSMLKTYDKDKMVEFYDALIKDMETRPWNFGKNDALKEENISKYIINKEMGLPVIIKHYHDVKAFDKRDELITKAITLAKTIGGTIYKLSSFKAIIDVVDSLGIEKTDELKGLIENIKTISSTVRLDNTSSTYKDVLIENIKLAKQLATYDTLASAKEITSEIITSLPDATDSNYNEVSKKADYILGKTEAVSNYHRFNESIVSALIKTKELDKAEALIDEISQKISTIGLNGQILYVKVATAYAAINNYEKVQATLRKIKFAEVLKKASLSAVKYLSNFDAFPESDIAFVDTDGDGKADFYKKGATQEQITASKIKLDDDIDGDGIFDDSDELPYKKN